MKKTFLALLILPAFIFAQDPPFSRGVNLTNWFQTNGAHQIQFSKYTKDDLIDIKSLGVDVIRLPINLHYMTDGAPEYNIDPLFYYFIDQVVDWTEDLGIHLILDNHTFDPAADTPGNIDLALIPVWTQMAEHFKNRSNLIYYEILNEPHGISDARWNEIQLSVVNKIRTIDSVHTIIVGPSGWNSYYNLSAMPVYPDDNLIYTFHFYDPFLFTHQGATWVTPSMAPLAGVPFPYNASEMPPMPPEFAGTWLESSYNNYPVEGTEANVYQLINIADQFQNERNVPLLCGEFGVYKPNSDNDDRVYWYSIVRQYLESKNIAWTIWDYQGGFGLFEDGTSEMFDHDFNVPLLEALGFNVPPQSDFIILPDSVGFNLYRDFFEHNINSSGYSDGTLDFYNDVDPHNGDFCIYWTGANQYQLIGFDFAPNKDLTYLDAENFAVDFWVKGDDPATKFDIRFLDTKTTEPGDHPWRNTFAIDQNFINFNNEWQHAQIRLNQFYETGSWDDGWFNPQGDFDWAAADKFEIVSEYGSLTSNLWFDDIKILDPNAAEIDPDEISVSDFHIYQNFPNPFNPVTSIRFTIPDDANVKIEIFDQLGQRIEKISDENTSKGVHTLQWNAARFSSGVYLLRIAASTTTGKSYSSFIKMMHVK